MAQVIQQRLHEVIQLIGMPGILNFLINGQTDNDFSSFLGENPSFGEIMMDKISRTVIMAAALALNCFTDGSISLERVLPSLLVR